MTNTATTPDKLTIVKTVIASPPIQAGAVKLEPSRWQAWVEDKQVNLSSTEYIILFNLATAGVGQLVLREDIMNNMAKISPYTLRGIIARLKQHGVPIVAVRGLGYKLGG